MSTNATPPADTGNQPGTNQGAGTETAGNPNPSNGAQPQTPATPPTVPPGMVTQEEANRLIGEARVEAKRVAKAELDRQAAEKQGEFQKLYDGLKPEYDTLKTENPELKTRITNLETRIHAQIDGEIKDWPAEVKESDPGKSAPLEQREAWASGHRKLAERLKAGTVPPNPEAGGGSNGESNNAQVPMDKATDQFLQRYPGPTVKK